MEARNKKIEDWFSMIKQGQVVLPRFQRNEAWRPAQVVGLLENILRDPSLPIGALLTLEVGDRELFHSRPIVGAPAPQSKPAMHLLDGQQRMTALWRSLTGDYEGLDFFISMNAKKPAEPALEGADDADVDAPQVEAVKRWDRKGVRQPVWANDPVETLRRGFVPVTILCPGSLGETALNRWEEAVEQEQLLTKQLTKRVEVLRQRVAKYDIPFLSLASKTGRDTALDVFIKMNTSATPLNDFDIVVAQLEEAVGQSLHEMVADLKAKVPSLSRFGSVEDNALAVAALLNGKPALKATYLSDGFGGQLAKVWPKVEKGFERGLEFLRQEGLFNEKLLPTEVAVYLTCALWADVPEHGYDQEGNARTLIRKALWRACCTNRYGKTATTRAFSDYKALAAMIAGQEDAPAPELFDESQNPLPALEELMSAGWPTRKDRLPRALLAVSLRHGSLDFADGARASAENIGKREYHHIFPVAGFPEGTSDAEIYRALNCALITWRTNRKLSATSPTTYIKDRTEAASLGETQIRQRLTTHLVPFDEMGMGDYNRFLEARAARMMKAIGVLCNGGEPELDHGRMQQTEVSA